MAAPTVIAAGIGATVSIIGGIINKRNAEDAAREAQKERDRINRQIQIFESNRQAIVNPYAGVVSLADMATDLSADLSNPFANLGVATSAAEIQIEQADIALANTLDTLQATGASAGGATALANAAKRSKKEVSANIQQQEAQNEKLSAQGEARLQQQQMAEKARIQNIQISEGGRAQNAQAQGSAFMFGAQETRDMATLDRMQAGVDQANVNLANSNSAQQAAIGSIITGVTGMASSLLQSGTFNSSDTLDKVNIEQPPVTPAQPVSSSQESNFNSLFSEPSRGDLGSGNY
tara:strand:+ start:34 stop:909 length:876 start_codon:yes stop_codon:yes gene_type:complete